MTKGNSKSLQEALPLTANQHGLFFLQQQNKRCFAYNIPNCLKLNAPELQVQTLIQACQYFVKQQPALNTRFVIDNGVAKQYTDSDNGIDFAEIDLSAYANNTELSNAVLQQHANQAFNLEKDKICRFRLFRVSNDQYYFLMVVHHIVFDGYSGLLIEDIFKTYQLLINKRPLEPIKPTTSFNEYSQQQQQWLASDKARQQIAFWQHQLADLPMLNLPHDKPLPITQQFEGDSVPFTISEKIANQLKDLVKQEKVTLSTLCLAVYKVLLQKHSKQDDLIVGMPVLGRDVKGLEKTVGYFANMLSIRSTLDPEQPFNQYVHQLTQQMWSCLANRDFPFVKLTEHINFDRSLPRPPIFQVSYAFQHFSSWASEGFAPVIKGAHKDFGDVELTSAPLRSQEGVFELALEILWNDEGDIHAALKYNSSIFERETIERMVEHYLNLLNSVIEEPKQSLSHIEWLGNKERTKLLKDFNQTYSEYDREACIHELIEKQAQNTPDAVALEFEDHTISYSELVTKMHQLGKHLQSLGVKPDTLVAICAKRSPEMIIGMLGILAAGGGYIAIDPDYPEQRIRYMVKDSRAKIILTQTQMQNVLSPLFTDGDNDKSQNEQLHPIYLDSEWDVIEQTSANRELERTVTSRHLAFVIYTSGSTGEPKGVMTEHQAVLRLVCNTNYYSIYPEDKIMQNASISFDAATWEVYAALVHGRPLVVPPPTKMSSQMLKSFMSKHKVNIAFFTSSLFQMVAKEDLAVFDSLRLLLTGGEVVPLKAVQSVLERNQNIEVLNVYGPTENTTYTTIYSAKGKIPEGLTSLPVGTPVSNTQVYIVDESLRPLPIGVPGELMTSGEGLARGYLNSPERTAEKFIDNPFVTDEEKAQGINLRLYKTGDLCRWMPDGNVEFVDRIDNQIKIRGFRVECGEIEIALSSHPDVQSAIVITKGEAASKYLLAFYTQPEHANLVTNTTLSAHLGQSLPSHMIPAQYVLLDKLPLTPNGKVDKKVLAGMDISTINETVYQAPRNDTENQLVEIWQEICGRQDIGIQDNFFDIGGNSLLVMSLVQKINDDLHTEITINDIFTYPTIELLLEHIEKLPTTAKKQADISEQPSTPHDEISSTIPELPSEPEASSLSKATIELPPELMPQASTLVTAEEIINEENAADNENFIEKIEQFNQTEIPFSDDQCLHTLVTRQVSQNPQAIALTMGSQQLTYYELELKSRALAIYLQSQGIVPETPVAICINRSIEMVIGILAILKAGGAYVPVDPKYPNDRISYLLENCQAGFVLTQTSLHSKLEQLAGKSINIVCIDDDSVYQQSHQKAIKHQVKPTNLAWIIYTSGSTGKPKGVMVEHRSAVNLCQWHIRACGVTAADSTTLFASISFDPAVWELFPYLMSGANVHILTDEQRSNAFDLQQYFVQHKITMAYLTTQMCEYLVNQANDDFIANHKLRYLATAGDKLSVLPTKEQGFEIVNGYGPTEGTVICTAAFVKHDDPEVTIGKPLDNTKIYVLDENLNQVPFGEKGELHICGYGVARGYFNSPDLTADKFIDNPFIEKENKDGEQGPYDRLYKTGDLVAWRPDGNIDFFGRIDNQVKIRGYRIELGEIETCLKNHDDVIDAIVVVQTQDTIRHLIAFYTQGPESKELTTAQLTEYIGNELPAHMIPADFILIDEMPLTPNGKVDRNVLTEKKVTISSGAEYVAPRNDTERKLVAIWQRVFQRESVGIHDDFFEIGGDSLSIMALVEKINTNLCPDVKIADIPTYPTVEKMAEFIDTEHSPAEIAPEDQLEDLDGIAVIGMACRVPGASNVQEYWENLKAGKETVSFFSDEELQSAGVELGQENYVPAKGYLPSLKSFDADFFGYSPREAQTMDPQQRIFLEESYHAIEDAGYNPYTYQGKIGVYAGSGFNSYRSHIEANLLKGNDMVDFQMIISNGPDFLASRVAYKLNLKGPAVVIQTACSTSLVAVKQACKAILRGSSDIALAGGVSLPNGFETAGYTYHQGMILSPDGRCRPFDSKAHGTVSSHGVGVVVLKDLKNAVTDGDNIRAVIKSAAINNDGSVKVGYTAPSVEGQRRVVSSALRKANISPEQISYIEAHGTATPMGDPIEMQALKMAFEQDTKRLNLCAIGSVKGNIGHTDASAGVNGMIKTILCLENKTLVPTLHYEQPNPALGLENSPFYVNTETKHWPTQGNQPRMAGISAFGIGGTNAHVILQEAPVYKVPPCDKKHHLLVFSAKSALSLKRNINRFYEHIAKQSDDNKQAVADIAYSLQTGRAELDYRQSLVVDQQQDFNAQVAKLSEKMQSMNSVKAATRPQIVLMFSGQGSQFINMGKDLYHQQPVFRTAVDTCCKFLENVIGFDLKSVIYPPVDHSLDAQEKCKEKLKQTQYSQVALFVIEYAYAKLWLSYDLKPDALIGHSVGEYVAACIAGVIGLEDGLRLIYRRGQLMQALPTGDMLSIELSEQQVMPYLKEVSGVDIAVLNHPNRTVVSGSHENIDQLKALLDKNQIHHMTLATSHAFHSNMMTPMLEEFAREFNRIKLHPPKVKYVSSMTGTWITPAQATDSQYWCAQLRNTVRFWQGLSSIYDSLKSNQTQQLLIEVGPGQVLSSLAKQHPKITQAQSVISSSRHMRQETNDNQFFLSSLGQLWQAGAKVSWEHVYATEKRKRVSLPGYAFENKEHWLKTLELDIVEEQPTDQCIWQTVTEKAVAKAESMQTGIKTAIDRQNFKGNEIIETIVGTLSEQLPATANLNVLEICSGTGELATVVLPLLPSTTNSYDFTCTSPKTWHSVDNYFKRYNFFNSKKLNIALSPQIQDFDKYGYDLVIAGTSLHKSANIDDALKHTRSLLAPGGILLIWEFCSTNSHAMTGLNSMVEYPNDAQYTQSHPFGSCQPWCEALLARGFDKIEILADAAVIGQNILLARADSPQAAFTTKKLENTAPTNEPEGNETSHASKTEAPPLKGKDLVKYKIKQVWEHYLGIEDVVDNDDFFARGGDSLIAVNVIAKLQQVFQQNLSFATLLEHTTIEALASVISNESPEDGGGKARRESSLVLIQKGCPDKEPLFMVHPAGGQVYFYRDLAQSMGEDYPIYGIQSLLTEEGKQMHVTIEEMAAHYIKDLRTKYPNKTSFILGGASLGGIIACEMAHQLKPEGIEVEAIVIVDAPGPNYMPKLYKSTAELLIYLADEKLSLQLDTLEALDVAGQIEYAQQLETDSEHSAVFPPNLSVDYLETLLAQNIAMHQYEFKSFLGDAIYFKHTQRMNIFPVDMERAWKPLVHGKLTVHQVPGTHITMNMAPHVAHIASALEPWLKGRK